jgi:tetratricopeptide (TPR) repeat protein
MMRFAPSTMLALLLASCASPNPAVKVRAVSSSPDITSAAEAEAQLALGNVGLALEGFRTALRQNPRSVRALTGMAHSYERMGRFDLSRKWYETALAEAPESKAVLTDFAGSLELQGKSAEAASVRAEVAELANSSPLRAVSDSMEPQIAPMVASSVTVALPPAAPAQAPEEAPALAPVQLAIQRQPLQSGPRLERLSQGVVALVTRGKPLWRAQLVEKTDKSATFRFVEVRPVARLLNAARIEGLAARTRARLVDNGWKRIAIGDAPAVRDKSVILYPSSKLATAKRLAAQFSFGHLREFEGGEIIVLLGRDSVRAAAPRPA